MSKKKSLIGLVVTDTSVEAAHVLISGKKKKIIKHSQIHFAFNQEVKGVEVLKVLHDLFERLDAKNSDVVCAINCQKTLISKLHMPIMPDKELAEAIRWEAKGQFPFPLDKAFLSHKVVDKVQDKDVSKLDVLVAATTHETIMNVLGYFKAWATKDKKSLNYNVPCLIPTSLAFEGYFSAMQAHNKQVVAVIYMEGN